MFSIAKVIAFLHWIQNFPKERTIPQNQMYTLSKSLTGRALEAFGSRGKKCGRTIFP